MDDSEQERIVFRHPVRGAVWGLVAGLGAALLLASFSVIAIGTLAPIVVVVVMTLLGIAWSLVAPPKTMKQL